MRALLIGDGLSLSSGFAQVLRHWATALVGRGHEVAQLASLDSAPNCRSEPYTALGVTPYFPSNDNIGFSVLQEVLGRFQPDVIGLNCDPGMAYSWQVRLQAFGADIPCVLYAPVEGRPVNRQFCEAFAAEGTSTVLYAKCAADEVEATSGRRYPWVYHGVDTTVFHPLPAADRARVREALGWGNRFVVAYVGRNCARKAQDVLIEAMTEVRRTVPDALLYLHAKQFDGYWGNGWDLGWLAERHGVADVVEFPSNQGEALRGEPAVSLSRKLACADLYVHAAQVEGLGLPILEAMASGLPIIIPGDGWVMEEIAGDAPLGRLAPYRKQTWFTGSELNLTLPEQWARSIHWARNKPEECAAAAERGLARATAFDWDVMTVKLVETMEQVAAEGIQKVEAEAEAVAIAGG